MRWRRSSSLAIAALVLVSQATEAEAAPPIRLHVADPSSCDGARDLPRQLARKGIVLTSEATDAVDVDVRVTATPTGATAELVLRNGEATAVRSLVATSCAEVLEALVFTLGLALEQPIQPLEAPLPSAAPLRAPSGTPTPPALSPLALPPAGLAPPPAWGGGAAFGLFAGASPDLAPAIFVHAEIESRARPLFAPSLVLGAAFVMPAWKTVATGGSVAFALQTATLDACPLRLATGRFSARPCVEAQLGRLQARSAGFATARLDASPWLAAAVALRGRAELSAGFALTLDVTGGSPLIQEAFSLGESRVFSVGPLIASGALGLSVHFP